MKKFAGYINLKNLNGVLYPSSIQNIIMKDYIQNHLRGIFYLSPTEVLQAKFPITLETLIGKETKVDGIVMLSSFYLPEDYLIRKQIYKKIIKINKFNLRAYYGLYLLDEKKFSEDIFKILLDVEKNQDLPLYDKGILNFLLSKKEKRKGDLKNEIYYLDKFVYLKMIKKIFFSMKTYYIKFFFV